MRAKKTVSQKTVCEKKFFKNSREQSSILIVRILLNSLHAGAFIFIRSPKHMSKMQYANAYIMKQRRKPFSNDTSHFLSRLHGPLRPVSNMQYIDFPIFLVQQELVSSYFQFLIMSTQLLEAPDYTLFL